MADNLVVWKVGNLVELSAMMMATLLVEMKDKWMVELKVG